MASTPELDRKLNGADNTKSVSSGEEDPCIVDSKQSDNRLGFRDRTEKKLREKSGLSRKGLLIAGLVLLVLLFLLIIVVALGASWPNTPHHQLFPVCNNAGCLRAAAQIRESLNTSETPCSNIWNWGCGGWLKNTPLPQDKSVWNLKEQLKVQEAARVRDLISTLPLPIHPGTVEWKLKHLYESCMNVENIDSYGIEPLRTHITDLGGWHILKDWSVHSWDFRRVLVHLHSKYGATPFFKITIEPNPQNPSKNSIRISPSGLGLPGPSFYQRDLDDKIVLAYMHLLKDIVSKLEATSSEAIKFSKDMFYYEKRIAEITPDPQHLENPIKIYNPISLSELRVTVPLIPLQDILVAMFPNSGISDETEILLSSEEYLRAISETISSTDHGVLNNYMIWSFVREYLPYLPSEYLAEFQLYQSQLTGIQSAIERWEFCSNWVQKIMGLAIQSMLDNKNPVSEKSTKLIKNVFQNIRTAAGKHINKSQIPSEYFKHLTQKISALGVTIGLPKNVTTNTFLKNYYSKLYVQKLNLLRNVLNSFSFSLYEWQQHLLEPDLNNMVLSKAIEKPFNVIYFGPTNSIIIPRSLLTLPYFDKNYPKAFIYGRLGIDISNAIVDSILPYNSPWTTDKGLLSPFHIAVNQSIISTDKSRRCLMNFMIKYMNIEEDTANLTSLSTLKHLTALRLTDTALTLALQNTDHIHQPTLEIYEDPAVFYMTYLQNQCSKNTEQQEMLNNLVDFKLGHQSLLLVSWKQIPFFSNAFHCSQNNNLQCSDIL